MKYRDAGQWPGCGELCQNCAFRRVGDGLSNCRVDRSASRIANFYRDMCCQVRTNNAASEINRINGDLNLPSPVVFKVERNRNVYGDSMIWSTNVN